jgi:predicted nucleotidyltransferase
VPVRSLRSSVLKWPALEEVDRAARAWASRLAEDDSSVVAVGYIGSSARGDWGVGSDLDLVIVRTGADRRGATDTPHDLRLESLPVPAELLEYDADEWRRLMASDRPFATVLRDKTVWLIGGDRVPGRQSG